MRSLNEPDTAKLAVIAALFVLIGDFIAFMLAVIAAQEAAASQDKEKKDICIRIKQLQEELQNLQHRL